MHALGILYFWFITQTTFSVLSLIIQNLNSFKLALGIQLWECHEALRIHLLGHGGSPVPNRDGLLLGWDCRLWQNTWRTISFRVRKKSKGGLYVLAGSGPPKHRHTLLPSSPACSMRQFTGEIGQTIKLDGAGGGATCLNRMCLHSAPKATRRQSQVCVSLYMPTVTYFALHTDTSRVLCWPVFAHISRG